MTNDQTVTQALKGCPFCGQAPTMEPWHGGAPTKVMIACPGLHPDDNIVPCEVAPQVTGETPAEAITAWNTRTAHSGGANGDYAEAFDILVDVQSALVLTAEHSQGTSVASFVDSSTQYNRLNKFLHARQNADPRVVSGEGRSKGAGNETLARKLASWANCGWQEYEYAEVQKLMGEAATALSAPQGKVERKFRLGDRVSKKSGSSWNGRIVGFYSTSLTPIGYAVESERELGSVQIYPENALTQPEAGGK